MLWLIDGYNVIRRDPDLAGIDRRSLEEGRDALLKLIARVARESPDEFLVVFDGVKSTGRSGAAVPVRIRVLFSRPPEKADDVLMRLARQHGPAAAVVTSDHTIQDAARRARAAAVGAEAFLARVADLDAGAADGRDDEEDEPRPKKGNPRRLSRDDRQVQRALARLRPPSK